MKKKEHKCKECGKDNSKDVKRVRNAKLCIDCYSNKYQIVNANSIASCSVKELKKYVDRC